MTILIAMLFMFNMLTKTLYGKAVEPAKPFRDLTRKEIAALAPIALLILAMGIFPDFFMEKIEPTVEASINAAKVIHVN